jgi:SNF2 family DNA or RNA helicase
MLQLYRHQKLAISYMRQYKSFALFMEQGCGKTLSCLVVLLELLKQHEITNILVVTPKATIDAWYRDINLFTVENGFNSADRELLLDSTTITNYEYIWRKSDLDKMWYESKKYKPNLKSTFDRVWDCIILDESHAIKNRTTNQARFVLRLALNAKYKYILTGTPIGNGALENLWSQYAFLFPARNKVGGIKCEVFGSYSAFIQEYAILDQYYRPCKYINVDKFKQIMSKHSYRVLKVDCLDLPLKLPDQIYTVELKNAAVYKEMQKHSTIMAEDLIAENGLAKLAKLRQLASGFVIANGVVKNYPCEKEGVLSFIVSNYDSKLVIFAQFKESIKSIAKVLTKNNKRYVIQAGDTEANAWTQFQNDPSIDVIICQYRAGSTGIDLFAADTIIYYEPTLSSTILEQSRDRIHRIGQKRPCSYIFFITKGTVEQKIYDALKRHTDFTNKLFIEYCAELQAQENEHPQEGRRWIQN